MSFDLDSCAVGFDGQEVWALPRAVRAFNGRYNLVDETRPNFQYEARLVKYYRRGFAVGVPGTIAMAEASVVLYFHAEHAKIPVPCMEKKRDTGATVHVSDGGERFGEM